MRAFRARLFDVQTELEKEKSKKDDGAGAWIERSRQLEAEMEWAKEVADRLERVNQSLLQENSRLKSQFASQEEDRNFLIKQLVSVKKDNARLRAEYTAIEGENQSLQQQVLYALHIKFDFVSLRMSTYFPTFIHNPFACFRFKIWWRQKVARRSKCLAVAQLLSEKMIQRTDTKT